MFRLFTFHPQHTNFENVQEAIKNPEQFILINVLPLHQQDCLIQGTVDAFQEENVLNTMLQSIFEPDKHVIIYGKHNQDERVLEKAKQIGNLGVKTVYMYQGGLFEWLLLQDIYGNEAFPTTKKVLDILKFKPIPTKMYI